jgi:hypothetical protein
MVNVTCSTKYRFFNFSLRPPKSSQKPIITGLLSALLSARATQYNRLFNFSLRQLGSSLTLRDGATMRCGSILGALVAREGAVIVSQHGSSQNRAAADPDERCRRQSQNASTRIVWCGSGGRGRCRDVLQLC